VRAVEEVLGRYDEGRRKAAAAAELPGSAAGGGSDGEDDASCFSTGSGPERAPPRAPPPVLQLRTSGTLAARLSLYRSQFDRHKEVSEAALLHSGYSQARVVEVIGEDVVGKIVEGVVREVDEGLGGVTDEVVAGL
jgi:hypothetical protein